MGQWLTSVWLSPSNNAMQRFRYWPLGWRWKLCWNGRYITGMTLILRHDEN